MVTIPGVSTRTAQVILAEIAADMSRFPSAGHLASWAGMCSGQQRIGRETQERAHHQGLEMAPQSADRSRPGRRTNKEHVPGCPIRPDPRPARTSTGGGCGRSLHPGHRLAPTHQRRALQRPRRRLLRQATQQHRPSTPTRHPTRSPRSQSHPRTSSRLSRPDTIFGATPRAGATAPTPRAPQSTANMMIHISANHRRKRHPCRQCGATTATPFETAASANRSSYVISPSRSSPRSSAAAR